MHRLHWLKGREPVRESLFVSLANSGRAQDHLTAHRYRMLRMSRIKAALITFWRDRRSHGVTWGHRAARRAPENGQTMVEFALIAPLALMLICGVTDYGRLFFVQASLEDAVQQAGRYASTGNSQSGLTRLQSIEAVLQQAAVDVNIPIQNIQISSLTNGSWVSGSAGGPGDTVAITVTMGMKLLTPMIGRYFPNGTYTFTASTTFQNEPFPVS